MIGFLRKRQPRQPVLAVLYWLVLLLVTLAVLFTAFWFLDAYLPGEGMF